MNEYYVFDNEGATADRYTVIIDFPLDGRPCFNYWTMSDDALMPNGCCIYGGTMTEAELSDCFRLDKWITDIPPQVMKQIERLSVS